MAQTVNRKVNLDDTTTIGSGLPGAENNAAPNTAVVVSTSAPATPTAGKPMKNAARKPKMQLPAEDEFAILLAQVRSCRQAGITVKWAQIHPNNVVALILPDAKICQNNHIHLGEKCNYCVE
jgi:hypothetical protein